MTEGRTTIGSERNDKIFYMLLKKLLITSFVTIEFFVEFKNNLVNIRD
jgi:hypothetical protein